MAGRILRYLRIFRISGGGASLFLVVLFNIFSFSSCFNVISCGVFS